MKIGFQSCIGSVKSECYDIKHQKILNICEFRAPQEILKMLVTSLAFLYKLKSDLIFFYTHTCITYVATYNTLI